MPKEKNSDPKKDEKPISTNNNNNDTKIAPVPTPQTLPKVENKNGQNQKENNNSANVPPPVHVTAPPPVHVTATAPPPPVPSTAPPPVPKKTEEKGKNEGIKFSHLATNDTCKGLNTCTDEGDMFACIFKTGILLCFN